MEKAESNVMKREPRSSKAGIFAGGLGVDVVYQGLLVSILVLFSYMVGNFIENNTWNVFNSVSAHGMTMAFLTMSMAEIFHSLNMRSQRGSLFTMKKQNIILWLAALGTFVLTTLVCEVKFLADAFGFTSIGLKEYGIALAISFCVIPVVEIVKLIQRISARKKAQK